MTSHLCRPSSPDQATPFSAFAACAPGLEPLLCLEVRRLGLSAARAVPGGVTFRADMTGVQRANLWLHTAERVLLRLSQFRADSFPLLERHARRVDWARHIAPASRLALSVTCHKSRLYHSTAVAERVFSAIERAVPRVQPIRLEDADADTDEAAPGATATHRVFVRLDSDQCTLSLDTSGQRLHRRGYRRAIGQAPLRETLAAAIVLSGGLQPFIPHLAPRDATATAHAWLLDPMCGSGTIPIEAARLLCHIAPGLDRAFAFERFPSHDATLWNALRAEAQAAIRPPPDDFSLEGRDIDADAIRAALLNAQSARLPEGLVTWRQAPIEELDQRPFPGLVISNPPYGHRLGEAAHLRRFFRDMGRLMRTRLTRSHLALLLPDSGFETALGLALTPRLRMSNGGIRVRLMCGEISKGSAP